MCVPALLREFDVEPAALLRGAGIDPDALADPENRVPFASVGRLLADASRATGCPHFGLLVGERAGGAVLGLIGQLAQHSRDVRAGLHALIVHFHMHDRGGVAILADRGGREVEFAYLVRTPGTPGTEHIADAAIAIEFQFLRELCGPRWKPTEVVFAHRRPAHTGPYRKFFKAPVRFDTSRSAITFDEKWLREPIAGSDLGERSRLAGIVSTQEASTPSSTTRRVLDVLSHMVVGDRASADQVARVLGTTRRTLHRRLADEDTTFAALRESVRSALARQLLRDTRMSLAEIAATLDYSEAAAFSRAFKGWTGVAPSAFRLDAGER